MAITAADVQAFAPELAGVATGILNTWITLASGAVSSSVFGSEVDNARLLWVAHQAVKSAGGASGTAGPVTSRQVGDVTVQNAAPVAVTDYAGLKTTAYGLAFMQLARRYTAGGLVVL